MLRALAVAAGYTGRCMRKSVDQSHMAKLMQEGASEAALALLEEALRSEEFTVAPERPDIFMTMFLWTHLAGQYPPARVALQELRDKQAERLLAGDVYFGPDGSGAAEQFGFISRFSLIVDINEKLGELLSTCELFLKLHSDHPALARRYARSALPALVDAGQFAMADQYRDDPLRRLEAVNEVALTFALHPQPFEAPRLAAELTNLVSDVRIGAAVLRGLGRANEADALLETLLSGLSSNVLKTAARRELGAPGTIMREFVDHQMLLEARDARLQS